MSTFTDKDWQNVLANLKSVLSDAAADYGKSSTAKLIAAIPYLADSEDPDRFAVSNLLTFHGATKARAIFDHRPSDDEDIFRRLGAFHVGNHADPKVVDYGLTLLALISLSDHEADADADRKAEKYNPINAGKWNPKTLREELEADLAKSPGVRELYASLLQQAANLGVWQ